MQNKKQTATETEDEDDDNDEEEEMPEEAGKTYDTSERGGRYVPIRKDPENDVIQIHTDREMPQGENTEKTIIGGQTEIQIDRIDTATYTIKEISGYEKFLVLQVKFGTEQKAHKIQYRETYKSPKTSCQAT